MLDTKREKLFSTGEFAEICNVPKHVLFHYDAIGLFCPRIVKNNRYRYYSAQQFETFTVIIILKNLGMSLQAIKTYLEHRSPDLLLHLLEEKKHTVTEEIRHLKQIDNFISEVQDMTLAVHDTDIHCPAVAYLEEEKIICSEELSSCEPKTWDQYNDVSISFYKNKIHSLNLIGCITLIDNMQKNNFDTFQALYAKVTHPYIKKYQIKKAGPYLIGYHQGSYNTLANTYQTLLQYAKEHGIRLGTYAYEEYLISDLAQKDEQQYITMISMEINELSFQKR